MGKTSESLEPRPISSGGNAGGLSLRNGNGDGNAQTTRAKAVATVADALKRIARIGRKRPRRRAAKRPFTFARRGSGVLMHITSLPGPHGSGDLGPAAFAFADFLAQAGQRWWQMLPVGPPDLAGNSPYSASSAFAGSPWLVSLERLAEDGLLTRDEVMPARRFSDQRVDYRKVNRFREKWLRRAFARFSQQPRWSPELETFRKRSTAWLHDWALFAALKTANRNKPWIQWPRPLRLHEPKAIADARQKLETEIAFHEFVQFAFDRQWAALKQHCNARDIGLIGDIPIFVDFDSCDVWAHPELFQLDASGRPRAVTGCPPDDFNPDGQLWRHPHYNWNVHRESGFAWWRSRFAMTMEMFDGVRIDHFLGMHRLWSVSPREKTARRGHWIDGPGAPLLEATKRDLGDLPIIAEDLGFVTPEALRLRDRFRFPGMRVMQFGFGGNDYNLPHTYVKRCVAYSGTHDNETIAGWLKHTPRAERRKALAYLDCSAREFPRAITRSLLASVADTVIFPTQDLLGLGDEARMNRPGTTRGNWAWRVRRGALTKKLAGELRGLSELYGRV